MPLVGASITNSAAGMSVFPAGSFVSGVDDYGGNDAWFNGISADLTQGNVHFLTPIAAFGGHDFFSLEHPININIPPIITTTPEPGTIALAGVGLAGLAALRRRRKHTSV